MSAGEKKKTSKEKSINRKRKKKNRCGRQDPFTIRPEKKIQQRTVREEKKLPICSRSPPILSRVVPRIVREKGNI